MNLLHSYQNRLEQLLQPTGHPKLTRLGAGLALVLLACSALAPLSATAANQNYSVLTNSAQTGMLLSQSTNASVAELATDKNAALLLGVLAPTNAGAEKQPGQVSIASEGQTPTLVSTLGGDIRVGDRIAPSSLAGVGTKATANGWIVGVAQASLDAKTTNAVASSVSDSKGGKHTVYLATIPVVIHVTYYSVPAATASGNSSAVPASVQSVADSLAGRHASVLGLVLSFILLLTGIIIVGIMLYASIKGGMDAISRQPLSKVVINRAMLRSLGTAAMVITGVIIGSLLLLRLL
jgi:hypothetical protein